MRLAIVGLGRIGSLHAQTLAELAGVDDVVAFDLDTARLMSVTRSLDIEPADSFDRLVASNPDGLVICTPTDTHASMIRRAIAVDLPVFTEKPVSISATETRRVLDQVRASEVPVQVGFQRRFDSEFRRARATVQGGQLGWLHTVRANTFDASPPPADYLPNSGGLFRDCGVHDFDAIRWITGEEVATVYALGANHGASHFAAAGDIASGSVLLTLIDGTHAHISVSRYNGSGYDVRMELLGARAQFEIARLSGCADFVMRFASAYREELQSFVEVVGGTHPPVVGVADALAAAWISDACEVSRARGRPVTLAEMMVTAG